MEENDLFAFRRQKLQQLLDQKLDPFGGRFDVSGNVGDVRQAFVEGERVRVAGRLTAHRNMGKSQFLTKFPFQWLHALRLPLNYT